MPVKLPFPHDTIEAILQKNRLDCENATIRAMVASVSEIEEKLGVRYLRMELGVPGIEPDSIGTSAESEALRRPKVANLYPPLAGLLVLREAAGRFIHSFLNMEIPPETILSTVGAMQGGFISQALCAHLHGRPRAMALVTPCFSVHRDQLQFLGIEERLVDLYDRTQWLDEIERFAKNGKIGGVLYSTPNNPSWMTLTENELKRLGEIATKYDIVAIEDAAYFGMDFRRDYSVPNQPPFPPTVARYTKNFIFLLSASKIFSYAGQRIGVTAISPSLAYREFSSLEKRFKASTFLEAFVLSGIRSMTSGATHSTQLAFAKLLSAASDGSFDYLKPLRTYGDRAKEMKRIFLSNGFRLVYAKDGDEPLADGFFFTIAYGSMQGGELSRRLLDYGISATTLKITGSPRHEAIRACSALIPMEDMSLLEERIHAFHRN